MSGINKKRLLVVISFSFSIRYIVRTGLLKSLKSYCEPVVALSWNEPDLIEELMKDGFEVVIIPATKTGSEYKDIRKRLDIWFRYFQVKSASNRIERKYLNQYLNFKTRLFRSLRDYWNIARLLLFNYKKTLFRKEKTLLASDTNFNVVVDFVDSLNIDAVFTVTPFHHQEDFLLRAASSLGKQMITSILSFDNITKRGWIPVKYDLFMVWNRFNKQELHRIYPYSKQKQVDITGPAQFDFYFNDNYLFSKNDWKRVVGIPENFPGKIILYAGGPLSLFPQEPLLLKDIDNAIVEGFIAENTIVLFRCHPVDQIERWKKVIGTSKNIFFDISWTGKEQLGLTNVTDVDIRKLCSTLFYTDVHINLCSTMTVDGSAYKKPQIGPAYISGNKRSSKLLAEMYNQEHFLPIMRTKSLRLAKSKSEMVSLINEMLASGYKPRNQEKMLREIITYADGKNTERVTQTILNFLQLKQYE